MKYWYNSIENEVVKADLNEQVEGRIYSAIPKKAITDYYAHMKELLAEAEHQAYVAFGNKIEAERLQDRDGL